MAWDRWVLDATRGGPPFCFCPVEGDLEGEYSVITGMNCLGAPPPGSKVVAIIHEGGNEAANDFFEAHEAEIDAILKHK